MVWLCCALRCELVAVCFALVMFCFDCAVRCTLRFALWFRFGCYLPVFWLYFVGYVLCWLCFALVVFCVGCDLRCALCFVLWFGCDLLCALVCFCDGCFFGCVLCFACAWLVSAL